MIAGNASNQVLTDENGQIVLCAENEGQEVFVYDDESGEYQRYVYVPNDDPEENDAGHLMQQSQQIITDQIQPSEVEQQGIAEEASKEDTSTILVTENQTAHAENKSEKSTGPKSLTLKTDAISELQVSF